MFYFCRFVVSVDFYRVTGLVYTVTPAIYEVIIERMSDFLLFLWMWALSHPVSVSIQLILIINSALVRYLLTLYIVEDLYATHQSAHIHEGHCLVLHLWW